jgi:peptidoglycan/xylan/chitin deacetylase (PgdA/CDA1 family)
LAKPAVCVTFDDGYADNALEALPILEELGVPATFFVTTELIGAAHNLWWHELEELLLGETAVPSQFALDEGGRDKWWATGTASGRLQLYQDLVRLMNDSEPGSRDALLRQLRSWAGCSRQGAQTHRGMALTELRTLAESSWTTVGAHTVTHSRLSALGVAEQREEITASKQQLEAWLDREITVFSYPFGRRDDFTRESMAICRQAGFSKAAANFPGPVHRWTDPYRIPRHLVRNWPVEQFAEKLRGFWVR